MAQLMTLRVRKREKNIELRFKSKLSIAAVSVNEVDANREHLNNALGVNPSVSECLIALHGFSFFQTCYPPAVPGELVYSLQQAARIP
jgi:hypothetical protein